ncbi:ATP-grasp fold amidoligase family protein [Enterococcus italicus]|uniref:Uncharacterized protein n=1 Tax=Enterococcus italicus (strain DSM 15952 / CCUG 50447 / LMG 22039 / TP 1.5) TaxID=888064 RepID=E6LD41_ENTI1|nr:ATP-grasp fold amidoligase family protein [Enterococcus italicus]EFU74884.1 hypothetical protein HMPREF9088_0290 [Enterococcus italicus DSM 15952]
MEIKKIVKKMRKIKAFRSLELTVTRPIPSKQLMNIQYALSFKKNIDWENPKTFNEKLQYIKLFHRDDLYTVAADKIKVKNYIAEKIDESLVIPNLGIWNSFDEIKFDQLPNQFVLKTNHDYAGVYVCLDKSKMNIPKLRKMFTKHLKTNYFYPNREWAYKNIPPKIFAEKLLKDDVYEDIIDYKFFAFNGYVDSVMICTERFTGNPKFYFFNKEWELLPYNKDSIDAISEKKVIKEPYNMNKMFEIAAKLSENIPFVRVDLYNVNGHIYFGEMTFYPNGGYDNKLLPVTDLHYGELIDLKLVKKGK